MTDTNSNTEPSADESAAQNEPGSSPPAEGGASAEASHATGGELEKLRAERDDFYNRYLRSVADLDNYRRRVQREKDELRQFAVRDLVESLLPVLEHLALAVNSAKQATDLEAIVTGVSMVMEQFRSALSGIGLVEINPAEGSDFDPHQHESLAHAPSDSVPAEKIVQVVRGGYSLNGRLIRPASVVLSGGPAAVSGENGPRQ